MIDIDETFKLTQGQGHKVSVSQYWKSNKHKSMSITGIPQWPNTGTYGTILKTAVICKRYHTHGFKSFQIV